MDVRIGVVEIAVYRAATECGLDNRGIAALIARERWGERWEVESTWTDPGGGGYIVRLVEVPARPQLCLPSLFRSRKGHPGRWPLPTLPRRSSTASELSEKHFLAILKKSERLLGRRVGGLIAEKTDEFELFKRQTFGSPPAITLLKPEITLFRAGYVAAVLETTGEFAGELAQAVGRRKGLAKQQRRWVKSQFLKFFHRMTSAKAAKALFREAFSSRFILANEEQSEKELVRQVTGTKATSRLLHSAYEAIEHAVALYPTQERGGQKPTPGEKVADPRHYPTMTISEVRAIFPHISRSTVYRWLDEGKLKRAAMGAAMGEKRGKRRSCFILTSSVKKLLKESSE